MPRPSDPNLLTTTEAREYLGEEGKLIAHDTLLTYVERGLLRQYHGQIGKTVYYDKRELNALLRVVPQTDQTKFIMPPMMSKFEDYVREKYSDKEPHSVFLGASPEFLPAPALVAGLLNIPSLTSVVCRRLLQGVIEPGQQDGEWTRWRTSENWYHPRFVDEQMRLAMSQDTSFDTMIAIREQYKVTVQDILIKISARRPTPEELDLLRMTLGQPVMEMFRVNYTSTREIVMVNHLVFKAELFELEFEYPGGLWDKK